MLPILDLRLDPDAFTRFLTRDDHATADALDKVRTILEAVRAEGDAALRRYTLAFDGCAIDELRVSPEEINAAWEVQPRGIQDALRHAAARISWYHEHQRPADRVLDADGVAITERVLPVARAGLYAPGGRASYPSTVLMTAIPAAVAGVGERVLCVPPGPDGAIAASTLAAAHVAEVETVVRVGGAQAIAAMAFGTESVPAAEVIVGPGNRYVTLAKQLVSGLVHIESMAGPSEVAIIADATAPPEYVAYDLCAQAEHGPAGTSVVVTWSDQLAAGVMAALETIVAGSVRGEAIMESLTRGGAIVRVADCDEALRVVDSLAPEHLEVMCVDARAVAQRVRNAGAIFVGNVAPAALGDYAVGTNHVLPTGRAARYASALRVEDFVKHTHIVEVTHDGIAALAPTVVALAELEGLHAHAQSVRARLGDQ
ncbi:MAG: histidinol dehydrogenase [Acidimicrobiia bacterium]